MTGPVIVWFRKDLRLDDHPALRAAVASGAAVVPVYIHAPHEAGAWAEGAASRWWLHHALVDLDAQLDKAGSRLIVRDARQSSSLDVLLDLVEATGATRIAWSRRYEQAVIERDRAIKAPPAPKPRVTELRSLSDPPESMPIDALELLPRIRWDAGIAEAWTPTCAAARARLDHFLKNGVANYPEQRDLPGVDGTSRLSPYLQFGQISARRIWHALTEHLKTCDEKDRDDVWAFARQLVWREFAHHLLFHEPHTPGRALQEKYDAFPWRTGDGAERDLDAWRQGRTGYPMVDAGMRQLWATGWMHNRVRMVVASFLVKHLLLDWRQGAAWFWDTLVDADLANNTLGWQWAAGCGADAAPYFRIFNPMTQGKRFDEDGAYVRTWCPELAKLPEKYLHRPFEAPAKVLADAEVSLGRTYPKPIIEHKAGRDRALDALATVTGG